MDARRAILAPILALFVASSASAAGPTYLAHAPAQPSQHPPLIVLLHGVGADEQDMISLWRDLPQTFVVASPRAPFPEAGGGWAWYRKARGLPRGGDLALSRRFIDDVVDDALRRFHADPTRVFLGGFSQGAVMTYEVALREPQRFRGAVVMSGSMFGSAFPASSAGASRLAVFIGHGTADRRIPFAAAKAARDSVVGLGVPVAFHAYAGMGHETGRAETQDVRAWLEERAAGAQPSRPK